MSSDGLVPSGFDAWLAKERERGRYLDFREDLPPAWGRPGPAVPSGLRWAAGRAPGRWPREAESGHKVETARDARGARAVSLEGAVRSLHTASGDPPYCAGGNPGPRLGPPVWGRLGLLPFSPLNAARSAAEGTLRIRLRAYSAVASDLSAVLPGFPKPRFASSPSRRRARQPPFEFVGRMTIAINLDEPHPKRDLW